MANENPAIPDEQPLTPFHDLDHYLSIPRVGGLALSPDGSRLVTTVSTLNGKGTEFATALWELDPTGQKHARRITRSAKGEAGAAFAANGDVYFTSARPDPDSPDDEPVSALWLLPADGGEARVVLSRPGGISKVLTAKAADATFVAAEVLAGSTSEEDDADRRKVRKDSKVSAILHSEYPVRYWDADLGPGQPRLFAVEPGGDTADGKPATVDAAAPLALRNLTPDAGPRLREADTVVSPDGRTIYTSYTKPLAKADSRSVLVAVDVASGSMKVLLDREGMSYFPGPVSPDGRTLAVFSERDSTPRQAPAVRLHLLDVSGDAGAGDGLLPLAHDWDRWPRPAAWLPDGSGLLVTADDDGASPVFRISVPAAAAEVGVTRLTQDAAAYSDVVVSPEGRYAYALRSSYEFPAEAVRIDLATGEATRLPGPVERPACPGRLERIAATAPDGSRVPAYLALPDGATSASPAPLLLWIHGGPLGSWNAWTWRWNPWLMTAKGYAVLLPDPALSTGYGQANIQRGWGGVGQGAVHGPDGRHRRGRGTARHRRNPDSRHGRILRRLYGQLGGRQHGPVQGSGHPCKPLGAGPVRPHHRRLAVLAQGNDRRNGHGELSAPPRGEYRHPHAGDPRRQGLPGTHRRGPEALVRAAVQVQAPRRPGRADSPPLPLLPG
ncbi:hypothetical protein NtRootA9_03240 [Arthrobacter sp. NtRootA9]|nr:hypothetical protein NtRootA9_03240 [Arthrobacter sp. NtRootA9]